MSVQVGWLKISRDLDTTSQDILALENYLEILTDLKPRQSPNVMLRVALESIDLDIGVDDKSPVTTSKVKSMIVKGSKALYRLILKLMEYVKGMYIKFTGNIRSVRRSQARLSAAITKLGSKTTRGELQIDGIDRLSVDGKFVGTDPQSLKNLLDVSKYLLNDHPKFVIGYVRFVTREFLNLLNDSKFVGLEQDAQVNAVLAVVSKGYVDNFKYPNTTSAVKDSDRKATITLVGNRALTFSNKDKVESYLKGDLAEPVVFVNDVLTMPFAEQPLRRPEHSEISVSIPAVSELKSLSNLISNILDVAEGTSRSVKDYDTVKVVIDDAIRQIEDSKASDYICNLVFVILGQISKKLSEPVGNFTHWLAITLNVYINLYRTFVTHYKDEGN